MSYRSARSELLIGYDLRASSDSYSTPVQDFEGDSDYSLADYRYAIFSGYLSSVSTLSGAAAGCGLSVDGETFERWKRASATAGLVDDFLDNSEDTARANWLFQQSLDSIDKSDQNRSLLSAGIDEKLSIGIGLLANSVAGLDVEQKHRSLVAAKAIGDIAVSKSLSRDIGSYIDILQEESRHTKDLVVNLVSADFMKQPGFEVFDRWCGHALNAATLADSSRDLWVDRSAGLTSVDATAVNSLRLAYAAANSARELTRSPQLRRATAAGMSARLTFSKMPTRFAMNQLRANVSLRQLDSI